MSRLLPYDLRNSFSSPEDPIEEPESDGTKTTGEKAQSLGARIVTTEDVSQFLPLFVEAANNKNYMGRLMSAKAVLPFIPFEKTSEYLRKFLAEKNIQSAKAVKRNHNFAHGILLQIHLILKNYYKVEKHYPVEVVIKSNFPSPLRKILFTFTHRTPLVANLSSFCPLSSRRSLS